MSSPSAAAGSRACSMSGYAAPRRAACLCVVRCSAPSNIGVCPRQTLEWARAPSAPIDPPAPAPFAPWFPTNHSPWRRTCAAALNLPVACRRLAAQVKAPKAAGQKKRLAPYSAHLLPGGASFDLVVKVYAGGPPEHAGVSGCVRVRACGPLPRVAKDLPRRRSVRTSAEIHRRGRRAARPPACTAPCWWHVADVARATVRTQARGHV